MVFGRGAAVLALKPLTRSIHTTLCDYRSYGNLRVREGRYSEGWTQGTRYSDFGMSTMWIDKRRSASNKKAIHFTTLAVLPTR